MKKATATMLKTTAAGLGGTILTVAATAKVTDVVYDKTGDWSLACSAGTGTAIAGIGLTTAGMVIMTEKETETWSAQDFADSRKLSDGLKGVTNGLDLVSKAMKVATFFSR